MIFSRRALALLALTTGAACSATNSATSTGTGGAGAAANAGSGNQGATAAAGGGAGSGGTSAGTGGVATPTTGGAPAGTGGTAPTGGAAPSTGGASPTGGAQTGGVSTGGVSTGGVSTGGVGGIDAIRKLSQICGESGEIQAPGYWVRSNKWNTSASGDICITALGDPGRTYSGFEIDSCSISSSDYGPGAYPSMVAGWHHALRTTGQGLPKKVNEATSIPTTWNYQAPSGKHNVSFDIWLHPQTDVDTPDGGMEFMIWVSYSGGVNPAGSQSGSASVAGGSWDVWTGTVSGWKYVAYKRTSNLSSFEDLDILPILKDAVSKGHLDGNWYILGIEAGFEIWNCSGSGAGTRYFTVKVN